MKYRDLRDFVGALEGMGELRRVTDPVSPVLEMTALSDLVLRAEGPALLFERPTGHRMPVLANLFGTPRRVALGMGAESTTQLREVGQLLATLKEPEPPRGMRDLGKLAQMGKALWDMKPALVKRGTSSALTVGSLNAVRSSAMRSAWALVQSVIAHLRRGAGRRRRG